MKLLWDICQCYGPPAFSAAGGGTTHARGATVCMTLRQDDLQATDWGEVWFFHPFLACLQHHHSLCSPWPTSVLILDCCLQTHSLQSLSYSHRFHIDLSCFFLLLLLQQYFAFYRFSWSRQWCWPLGDMSATETSINMMPSPSLSLSSYLYLNDKLHHISYRFPLLYNIRRQEGWGIRGLM